MTDRVVDFLLKEKDRVINIYGDARVSSIPGKNQDLLCSARWVKRLWGKNRESIQFITELMIHLFTRKRTTAKHVMYFKHSPYVIYSLRVASFCLRTVVCSELLMGPSHPLWKCAKLVLCSFKTGNIIANDRKSGFRALADTIKLCQSGGSNRFNMVQSAERVMYFKRYFTQNKRLIGTLNNNLITAKWLNAENPDDVTRIVNPDVNYPVRLARCDHIINNATELSIEDLTTVIDLLALYITDGTRHLSQDVGSLEHPPQATDADLLYIFNNLNTAGNSRFRTKMIEVNVRGCYCHTKCTGNTGLDPYIENYQYDVALKVHAANIVCGLCRINPAIVNTTSYKPRRYINSLSPSMNTCSIDGCASFKNAPLYTLDVADDGWTVRYSHKFYISNAGNVCNEVSTGVRESSNGRFTGICFGGKRTCIQKIVDEMPSAKEKRRTNPFTDYAHWWTCTYCGMLDYEKEDKMYERRNIGSCIEKVTHTSLTMMRNAGVYDVDEDTDISMAMTLEVMTMCRGCRTAVMCHHFLPNHVNAMKRAPVNEYATRRLSCAFGINRRVRAIGLKNLNNACNPSTPETGNTEPGRCPDEGSEKRTGDVCDTEDHFDQAL